MFRDNTWIFFPPQPGWRAFVADIAADIIWHDGAWQMSGFDNLAGVGINATADATNRLAVSAGATLLTHEGADHQLKINKADPADTASVLFQTGFSGRAEMGTTGTDDFTLKVSDDGSSWATALRVTATTGVPDLAAETTINGQQACHRGNLLGGSAKRAACPQVR